MALAIGQGPLSVAMAMPVTHDTNQTSMSMDMVGMDMSASDKPDCCPPSAKDKAMKDAACNACCAAMAQTAMLPFQAYAPIQYAVTYSYDLMDTTAASKTLPPEPPPPKA